MHVITSHTLTVYIRNKSLSLRENLEACAVFHTEVAEACAKTIAQFLLIIIDFKKRWLDWGDMMIQCFQ